MLKVVVQKGKWKCSLSLGANRGGLWRRPGIRLSGQGFNHQAGQIKKRLSCRFLLDSFYVDSLYVTHFPLQCTSGIRMWITPSCTQFTEHDGQNRLMIGNGSVARIWATPAKRTRSSTYLMGAVYLQQMEKERAQLWAAHWIVSVYRPCFTSSQMGF